MTIPIKQYSKIPKINNKLLFERQCRKLHLTSLSSGWPDRLVLFRNRAFAVEIKNPEERLRPNQKRMIEALRNTGVKCFVFRGEKHFWRDVIETMKKEIEEYVSLPLHKKLFYDKKREAYISER